MTDPANLLVERLGIENARVLAGLAGGTRLSVPAQTSNAARLQSLVGEELAILLILHFGGLGRVYVPRLGKSLAKVDERAVMRLSRRNWPASRIARKLGCTERTVHSIRAKSRRKTSKGPSK